MVPTSRILVPYLPSSSNISRLAKVRSFRCLLNQPPSPSIAPTQQSIGNVLACSWELYTDRYLIYIALLCGYRTMTLSFLAAKIAVLDTVSNHLCVMVFSLTDLLFFGCACISSHIVIILLLPSSPFVPFCSHLVLSIIVINASFPRTFSRCIHGFPRPK